MRPPQYSSTSTFRTSVAARVPVALTPAALLAAALLVAVLLAAGCSSAPPRRATVAEGVEVAVDPAPRRAALVAAGVAPLSGAQAERYMQRLELRLRPATLQTPVTLSMGADGALRMTVPAAFAFVVDGAQPLPAYVPGLDALAAALREFDRTLIDVVGHSDSIGTREANVEFTRRRAQALADQLLARGVAAGRVVARGAGEAAPLAPNDSVEGRQRNRRVELVLTPLTR
jgi:outer membrane protein OmpA-like peptidoglycan-associated protein